MDYYKDLKSEDYLATTEDHLAKRVKPDLAAGFTFGQCRDHHLNDFALALKLTKAEILAIVGPNTGYIFLEDATQHLHDSRRHGAFHW